MRADQSSTSDGSHGVPSAVRSRGSELGDRPAERLDRPHQVLGEVDAVNRHVEQVAGSGPPFQLPPAPARLGQIEKPLAAEVPRRPERPRTRSNA